MLELLRRGRKKGARGAGRVHETRPRGRRSTRIMGNVSELRVVRTSKVHNAQCHGHVNNAPMRKMVRMCSPRRHAGQRTHVVRWTRGNVDTMESWRGVACGATCRRYYCVLGIRLGTRRLAARRGGRGGETRTDGGGARFGAARAFLETWTRGATRGAGRA